ncbi:MAG TPA: PAS domain-containing protein [Azospirillum sp.]|nr:PAS domain-containing protein [Azospirillum sp.]
MRNSEMMRLINLIPAPAFAVERSGRVRHVNRQAADFLGLAPGADPDCDLTTVIRPAPPDTLAAILENGCHRDGTSQGTARLVRPDGTAMDGTVSMIRGSTAPDSLVLCVFSKAPFPAGAIGRLMWDNEILKSMAEASSEAMWCIEFGEPVDLAAGHGEIIRQVFENECRWVLCNSAMAKVYNIPEHVDLNEQPVHRFFSRSPENEAFIERLIEGNFCIDGVPSCDIRHDGTPIYVENTVRCHIENGMLLRMIGTVRDLTPFKKTEIHLTKREEEIREILTALPDAVVVMDQQCHLRAANPAFGKIFDVSTDAWLGRDIRPLIDFSGHLGKLRGNGGARFVAQGGAPGRPVVRCEISLAQMPDRDSDTFVAVLRPLTA